MTFITFNKRFIIISFSVSFVFLNTLISTLHRRTQVIRQVKTSFTSFKAERNYVDRQINRVGTKNNTVTVPQTSKFLIIPTTNAILSSPFPLSQTLTSSTTVPTTTAKTTQLHATSFVQQGLVVDWWYDVCLYKTTWNSRWLPRIPRSPDKTTTILTAGDTEFIRSRHFRRIYGYLKTNHSGYHEIQLKSRDGSEMLLLAGLPLQTTMADEIRDLTVLSYWNLTFDEINEQERVISNSQLYNAGIKRVLLSETKMYFIEILHWGTSYGAVQVLWKTPFSNAFQMIGKNHLFHNLLTSSKNTPSRLWEINVLQQKYPISPQERRRLGFHKLPVFSLSSKIQTSNFQCPPTNWYKRVVGLYGGRIFVDYTLVYPKSHFEYIGKDWSPERLLLNEREAVFIVNKTFNKMNKLSNNSLKLQNIVHIQHNIDGQFHRYPQWWQTHYFVEFDVLNRGQLYRSSVFVHKLPNNDICFMSDYAWKGNARINLLTPVGNQISWLEYMAEMLEEILKKTSEKNVNWIVIDFNSTDGDVAAMLNSYSVPHLYVRVDTNSSFNKVKSLNIGLSHVTDDESIVFVLDLHLQLPLNIFDRVRKLTIRGKTAFCPTLLKFQCGEHEQFTTLKQSLWIDDGFGMMAMYKTDWTRIGGFNEKMFGKKWGGEDWEVVDRIVRQGIFVIHNRLPRFYHLFHSNNKAWDGTHL